MEKNFKLHVTCFALALALIISGTAIAQNGNGSGAPWKTLGNSVNDSLHFIGTSNDAGLVFRTNLIEKARLMSDGKFGIGTAAPIAKLSVIGEGISGLTTVLDISDFASSPLMRILDDGMVGIGTASPTARLMIRTGGNTEATSALGIHNNIGASLFYVKDNGFTGIRTSVPKASLHVFNGTDADIDFSNGAGYIVVGDANAANIAIDNNEIMARDNSGVVDPLFSATLHLQAQGGELRIHNSLAVSQRVVINNNGFLGIGTTNPTSSVDVHGDISFDDVTGDKISLFDDRIGLNTMYGFGVDAGTLYYKSNGTHKWYSQTNAGAGTPHMTLTNGGFLGLGTENPNVNLTIEGANARMVLRDNAGNNSANAARIELLEYAGGNFDGGAFLWWNGDENKLFVGTKASGVNENVLVINRSGLNVGIGTSTPDNNYRLSVNGRIRSKEVVVESGWSDFVFDEGYELRKLDEVEKFIKDNGHLPGIPSAEEVHANGVALGEMQSKLLMKIEELTLYVIELKKENELLRKSVNELSK